MYRSVNILKSVSPEGVFQLNKTSFDDILKNSHSKITLQLPIGSQLHNLELNKSELFGSNFYKTYSSTQISQRNLGSHYQGKLSGFENSSVAISFTNLGVVGLILDGENQYEISPFGIDSYKVLPVEGTHQFECGANLPPNYDESKMNSIENELRSSYSGDILMKSPTATTRCLNVYWEGDTDIYDALTVNSESYLSSLFNAVQLLFSNDGVQIYLSDLFVNSGTSFYFPTLPYNQIGSDDMLYEFEVVRPTFNGDAAQLFSFNKGYGQGIAWVNALCLRPYAFCWITSSFQQPMTYSWTVAATTHEHGHTFGCPHTHSCSWNTNNFQPGDNPRGCSRIDSCRVQCGALLSSGCTAAQQNPGYGTCAQSPTGCGPCCAPDYCCGVPGSPAGGGTIMSYCHQVSVGTNLNLGFGPQPRQRMLDSINSLPLSCIECLGPPPPEDTPTQTPTNTSTPTPTKTINATPNPTPTNTQTSTPTLTKTQTLTPTKTQTKTPTNTPTVTKTSGLAPCNQYSCNTPILSSTVINGISITISITGETYPHSSILSSCNDSVTTPIGATAVGTTTPYNYNLSFSSPINSIVMYIAGAGLWSTVCAEIFTVSTNSGNPLITSPTNCFTTINNNVITIDPNGSTQLGGGGGIFLISNTTPFTSVSVSGLPNCNGSILVFCGDSIICPEPLPTPTATPTTTQTITPTTCCSRYTLTSPANDINGSSFLVTNCDGSTEIVNVPRNSSTQLNCVSNVVLQSGLATFIKYPGCICGTPTPTPTITQTITPTCGGIITIPATPPTGLINLYFYPNPVYTNLGTIIHSPFNLDGTSPSNIYLAVLTTPSVWRNSATTFPPIGPLNRSGKWPTSGGAPFNTWIGFADCITVSETKTYWVGVSADNVFKLVVDGDIIVNTYGGPYDYFVCNCNTSFQYWHIYPITLSSGGHTIELYGLNRNFGGIFGCEIYNNTIDELTGATTLGDLNIIFTSADNSTAELTQDINGNYLSSGYTCPTGYIFDSCNLTCYTGADCNPSPTPTQTNTPTPTQTPNSSACEYCLSLHPCSTNKFFSGCCEPFDTYRIYTIPSEVADTLVDGQSYYVESVGFSGCAVYDSALTTADFSYEYINITAT